jgi:hypothetical protein
MPDANDPGTSDTPETDGAKGTSSLTGLKKHVKPISLERLIEGFPVYFKTARQIIVRPSSFVSAMDVNSEQELRVEPVLGTSALLDFEPQVAQLPSGGQGTRAPSGSYRPQPE